MVWTPIRPYFMRRPSPGENYSRIGYVWTDPNTERLSFFGYKLQSFQPEGEELQETTIPEMDEYTPWLLRYSLARLYKLCNAPAWYSDYEYAIVTNDGELICFKKKTILPFQADPYHSVDSNISHLTSDPPSTDAAYRAGVISLAGAGPYFPPAPPPSGSISLYDDDDDEGEELDVPPLSAIIPLLAAPIPTIPPPYYHAQEWTPPSVRNSHLTSELLSTLALLLAVPVEDSGLATSSMICELPKVSSIPKPQKRVCDIMIADAMSKNLACPITMNPLTLENAACVSPCYHVFEKEAIQHWLTKEKSTCPECRTPCTI